MDLSSCFLKLVGAEKVSAQDGVPSSMFCLLKLIEVFGNGICNEGLGIDSDKVKRLTNVAKRRFGFPEINGHLYYDAKWKGLFK